MLTFSTKDKTRGDALGAVRNGRITLATHSAWREKMKTWPKHPVDL